MSLDKLFQICAICSVCNTWGCSFCCVRISIRSPLNLKYECQLLGVSVVEPGASCCHLVFLLHERYYTLAASQYSLFFLMSLCGHIQTVAEQAPFSLCFSGYMWLHRKCSLFINGLYVAAQKMYIVIFILAYRVVHGAQKLSRKSPFVQEFATGLIPCS